MLGDAVRDLLDPRLAAGVRRGRKPLTIFDDIDVSRDKCNVSRLNVRVAATRRPPCTVAASPHSRPLELIPWR